MTHTFIYKHEFILKTILPVVPKLFRKGYSTLSTERCSNSMTFRHISFIELCLKANWETKMFIIMDIKGLKSYIYSIPKMLCFLYQF